MKRPMKLLSFLLALTLLIGAVMIAPVSASAEDTDDDSYVVLYAPDDIGNIKYDPQTHQPEELHRLSAGDSVQGVVCDRAARTVTLEDFRRPDLTLAVRSETGVLYTVIVKGDCELAGLGFLSGGAPHFAIEGDGVLTVNADHQQERAIRLFGNDYRTDGGSKASLCFGRDVRLRLYGASDVISALTTEEESPFQALNGETLTCETGESTYEGTVSVEGYTPDPYTQYLGYRVAKADDPAGVYAANEEYDEASGAFPLVVRKYIYIEEIDAYLHDRSFAPLTESEGTLPEGFAYVRNPYGARTELNTRSLTEETCRRVRTAQGEEYLVEDGILDGLDECWAISCRAFAVTVPACGAKDADGRPYAIIGEPRQMSFVGGQDPDGTPPTLLELYTGLQPFDGKQELGERAISADDPDGVYCYRKYTYDDDTEAYGVSRYVYDETRSHYFDDESFEPAELSEEEFKEKYTPLYEEDGETPVRLYNEENYSHVYSADVYTDGEKQYACQIEYDEEAGKALFRMIYTFEPIDGLTDSRGRQQYALQPAEVQDFGKLTEVTEVVRTGAYEHIVPGTELMYNIDAEVTEIDTMDIGNIWNYRYISGNPFCEPRYIPFNAEVNPAIEGAYIEDEIWTNTADGSVSHKKKPRALKPGSTYVYSVVIKARAGYRFAENVRFTCLGEVRDGATVTLSGDRSVMTVDNLDKVNFLLDTPALNSVSSAYGGVTIAYSESKGAEKYRIFRREAGTGWKKLADTAALSYTDKTAVPGTAYTYTVRCVSDDGKTFQSGYDTKGKSVTYVAAPVMTKLENINSGTRLTWKASKGAVYYRVFVKNGSKWKTLGDTKATVFTATKLTGGTGYIYTVRAMNAKKQYISGYNTAGWGYTFIAPPALPKLVNTSNGVQITYTKPKGGVYFRIFRKTGSGKWVKLTDTSAVKVVDKTAKNGVKYTYTIRCISKDGKKYYSGYNTTGRTITCKR